MKNNPHFIFLVNPKARSGNALARLRRILAGSPELALRSEVKTIHSPGEVTQVLREMAGDQIPVAAGGDGTVNMLVKA